MKIALLVFYLLAALKLTAQKPDTSTIAKPAFFIAGQIGLLEGSTGSAALLQTVAGVQYHNWGLGLGVGIDKYRQRSIPVFVQVQRRLPLKKVPVYVYADGGLNMPWLQKAEGDWQIKNNKNGLYLDGGLQYHWLLKKEQALVFSLGYSEKRYMQERTIQVFCLTGTCPDQTTKFWYTYRRIAVKAGWRF